MTTLMDIMGNPGAKDKLLQTISQFKSSPEDNIPKNDIQEEKQMIFLLAKKML